VNTGYFTLVGVDTLWIPNACDIEFSFLILRLGRMLKTVVIRKGSLIPVCLHRSTQLDRCNVCLLIHKQINEDLHVLFYHSRVVMPLLKSLKLC